MLGRVRQREEAHQILMAAGKTTLLKIVACDLEAMPAWILYLGASSCPMTAWLWVPPEGGAREVRVEPGFPAFPADPPDWALTSGMFG